MLFGFLALFLMVFVLVACGDDNDTTDAEETPAPETTETNEPADTGGDTVRIVIPLGPTAEQYQMALDNGGDYGIFDRTFRNNLMDRFAELGHEVEIVDWGWAEALDQQQRSMIAAGNHPDMVIGEVFMPTYANEDILEPLPQDIVDMVNPSFLINNPAGEPVAVAVRSSVFMLFYNYDLLAEAGFDTPPTTWEEWQTMSDAITAAGNGEFFGGGVPAFPHAGGALRATPFFRQMGTDFLVDGELAVESEGVMATLEFIREMSSNFPLGISTLDDEGPMWNAFEEDQTIAFAVNGTWQVGGLERNGVNWGVAPLPIPAGGQEGNTLVGAVYAAVPRGAANQEASFEAIRVALSYDVSSMLLREGGPSPRQDIIDNEELWMGQPGLEQATIAVSSGEVSGLASFPTNDGQVWEVINQQIISRVVIDTNTPISTIVADAAAQIRSLMGE